MEENKEIKKEFITLNTKPEEAPMPDLSLADAETVADCIHNVLYEKKGRNISTVKVSDKTIIADYFVLCSGTSGTQVKALAEIVADKMKEAKVPAIRVEGHDGKRSEWIAVDFGSVIVHIFTKDAREFYDLDRLYGESGEIYTLVSDEQDELD